MQSKLWSGRRLTKSSSVVKAIATALTLLSIMVVMPLQASNDKDKNKIKYKVLQNRSNADCAFSGEVVLDVRYKLHKAQSGEMAVEYSTDELNYIQVKTKELDGRRGHFILNLDVGDCSQDIRLTIL